MDKRIGNFEIADEIRNSIASSDIFLADISDEAGRLNGNVYHEVGFAQALRKPVITIIAGSEESLLQRLLRSRIRPSIAFNLQGVKHLTLPTEGRTSPRNAFVNTLRDHLLEALKRPQEFVVFKGKQFVDRELIIVLLELHMRSARLAILDEFDVIIAEGGGATLSSDQIYQRFGAVMNTARNMLKYIVVELTDDFRKELTLGNAREPLSTYVAGITEASKRAYSIKIVRLIGEALQSSADSNLRRSRLNEQLKEFQDHEYMPLAASLIKSAYFEKDESF